MKRNYLFSIIFVFLVSSCSTTKHNSVLRNPYKNIQNYNGSFSSQVKDKKIRSPNQFVLNRINQMDSTDVYSGYELTEAEKNTFMEYYHLLPAQYQELIGNKVFAIYFIENFKGTGMSDWVFDNNNDPYIILYLNKELLNKSMAEWIEYRDNSPFINNVNITIDVNLDTSYLALLFGLLHETSHIYDFYNNITPYLDPYIKNIYVIDYSKSFTKIIWDDFRKPGSSHPIFSTYEISFYDLGAPLDKELSLEFYERLSNSPFSSLYGATSWSEDFAETFTYFYLDKHLGIRYEITVTKNSKPIITYCPTDNPLVVERYKTFKELELF